MVWESLLLLLIVYVPYLQKPFGTSHLPPGDWLIILLAAFTIVPILEIAKALERHGWFGKLQ